MKIKIPQHHAAGFLSICKQRDLSPNPSPEERGRVQ